MRDIQVALRQFSKSPAFAITVILTIALGIGANTAIFSLVHTVLLKSLPVADPHSLYRIGDANDQGVNGGLQSDTNTFSLFANNFYHHLRNTTPEFDQLTAMQSGGETMAVRLGATPAKPLHSEYVSGNYFQTFGISPYAGRLLRDDDDREGAAPVVVLSYQAWQSNFSADPRVLGATLFLEGHPVTVAGIAPAGFYGDRLQSDPPALFIPLSVEPLIEGANSLLKVDGSGWLYLLGRVKPHTVIPALQDKVSASLRQWLVTIPAYTANGNGALLPKQHVVFVPGGAGILNLQKDTGQGLHLLMALSALVLLVACANVANLLLARLATRKSEIAVRIALGAARTRLLRQMLTESLLLAAIGGIAGIVLAYAGTRLILSLAFPAATQLPIDARPSLPVLAFCLLLTLATGALFGIVPAWLASRAEPAEAIRGGSRATRGVSRSSDGASFSQRSLIVFQAALSLVLLVGAGLLSRSLQNVAHQDFGLKTENRYVVHIDPAGAGYNPQTLQPLYQQLEAEFSALPGVQSVGLALYSPLEHNTWGEGIFIDGKPAPAPNSRNGANWDRVSPGFLATVGQPLLRGRGITDQDTATSRKVAVVTQTFVKHFFPNEDPIGHRFGIFEPKFASSFEIVGVVADAKYSNPRDETRSMYFRPLTQTLTGLTEANELMAEGRSLYIDSVTIHFKQTPDQVDALIRRTLNRINPDLTVTDLHTLDYQVAGNFSQEKMIARLTLLFGILALVLASIGLYGITSYQVARRTSEIGLRMALGANRANVIRLILRSALTQAGLGLLLGIPAALLAARLMADQLYHVKAWDPVSLMAATTVLVIAALLAGLIPAQRASRIEPMAALRTD